jgi:Mitochondrial inner membrane protein
MDASPATPSSEEPAKPRSDAPDALRSSEEHSNPASAAPDGTTDVRSEPDAPETPRRRGLPPAVSWLGLVTAGIGLVLAALGVASLLVSRDNGVRSLDTRLAGVERNVRELASRPPPAAADPKALDAVASRVAKLEAAPAAPPQGAANDSALSDRVAALEAQLKTVAETIGSLGRRDEEVFAAARDARARVDANTAAVADLAQKVPAATAAERGAVEDLGKRVSALEALGNRISALERSQQTAERGDRALRLALGATALNTAVERGDAFTPELAAVKALGGDPKLIAALEPFAGSGVPPAASLAREFSELAPSLQASTAPSREGVLARLQANAEKLVQVRRLDAPAGSDAGAIVARAEAKAARGDVGGAASELGQLPPDARARAQAWITHAQARQAAIDASRRLAADALAGVGK